MAHEADPDFFTGADLELARWALQGDGSGSVFQTMDQLAQEFIAAHFVEETVYRPEPPIQPHYDPGHPVPARSLPALVPTVHALFSPAGGFIPDTLSHTISTSTVPPEFDPATPDQQQGFDHANVSAPPPSTHQVVRPRPQRPQRDRRPPACGTSSHLHPHPAQDSD
ncbi:hypothetical protein PIB30_007996 [Stylosanthes scabra]|uniref:Uncharacterized protein n=1 Tax=Stylosanthes scabra TaxID=79078 RepID=A0ABU6U3N1_9FABA|nr:hypothetical protein [Stylosanthes scabra]